MSSLIRNFFSLCRVLLAKSRGVNLAIGKNVVFSKGVFFSRRNITFGNNVYVGRGAYLSCHINGKSNLMIASGVAFVGGDHKIDSIDVPMIFSGRDIIKPITIEDDVWVGHGAIILHGVTLATGAVVAAGAVVTKDVAPGSIVAGNPAQHIRFRKT